MPLSNNITQTEPRQVRRVSDMLGLAGLSAFGGAVVSAAMAAEHMKDVGRICGGETPHCHWCYTAVALSLIAAGLFMLAVGRTPPARARAATQ